ncbi:MAG TPA: hypothetical protein VNE00_30230 [Paraburkholderia sp.]|nr:hypothetical protein [Paraburkholderia sp.]
MLHESDTSPADARLARALGAIDTLGAAVAGFALLAGARVFMFIALLAWREPVLGGAGLVLLAVVGWFRWFCTHVMADKAGMLRRSR